MIKNHSKYGFYVKRKDVMGRIKNYFMIWNDPLSFTVYSFVQKIIKKEYDIKQLIKCNSDYVKAEYSYVIIDGITYKIWSNVVVGNINIIAIERGL